MKIMAEDRHVGYINSSIELEDRGGDEVLVMASQVHLRMNLQGLTEILRVSNRVILSARHELLSSESSFSLGRMSGELLLEPTGRGEMFDMRVVFNDISFNRQIRIPEGVVLFSPLLDSSIREVRPGRSYRLRTVDPFSFTGELQTIEVRGLATKRIEMETDEREMEVTVVEVTAGELTIRMLVDEFGRVIRQETPLGLVFVHSPAQTAMKVPDENALDPMALLSGGALAPWMNLPGGTL